MPQKSQDEQDDDVLTFSHGTSKGLSTALHGRVQRLAAAEVHKHHEAL